MASGNKTREEDRSEVGKMTAEKLGKAVQRADILLDGEGYLVPVVELRSIKLQRRDAGGYLLICCGSVDGARLVCFKDVTGLADVASVVAQVAMDRGAWKADKYAIDRTSETV